MKEALDLFGARPSSFYDTHGVAMVDGCCANALLSIPMEPCKIAYSKNSNSWNRSGVQ